MCMGGGGSAPSPPPLPPPLPPPPTPADPAVTAARDKNRQIAALAAGRDSTIQNSGGAQGLSDPLDNKKQLTGV